MSICRILKSNFLGFVRRREVLGSYEAGGRWSCSRLERGGFLNSLIFY